MRYGGHLRSDESKSVWELARSRWGADPDHRRKDPPFLGWGLRTLRTHSTRWRTGTHRVFSSRSYPGGRRSRPSSVVLAGGEIPAGADGFARTRIAARIAGGRTGRSSTTRAKLTVGVKVTGLAGLLLTVLLGVVRRLGNPFESKRISSGGQSFPQREVAGSNPAGATRRKPFQTKHWTLTPSVSGASLPTPFPVP